MMTTLQIVLAIVGVVLIGAIVIYNLVQERRFRREAERMFSHRREDIMLGEAVHPDMAEDDSRSRISLGEDAPARPEVSRAVEEAEATYAPYTPARSLMADILDEARLRGPSPAAEVEAIPAEAPAAPTWSVEVQASVEEIEAERTVQITPEVEPAIEPESAAEEVWAEAEAKTQAEAQVDVPAAGPAGASPEMKAPAASAPAPASRPEPEAAAQPEPTPAPAALSKAAPPPSPGVPPSWVTPPAPSPAPTPESIRIAVPPAQEEEEAQAGIRGSGLDNDTEFVARIRFATPSAANFGPMLSTLRRIGKPIRAFGKRLDGIWEPLTSHPRVSYDQVEIGLQLADRNGAVSHDQIESFCRALYGFAAEEGGAVSCPDKQAALEAARALDMLCMEVDVLIGLNVIASDTRPFTSEAIHKYGEESKLVLEADGTYHAKDTFGHRLFTLVNQDEQPFPKDGRGLTVHGLTLLFDVPRVADGLAVFDHMIKLGFDLAWRLEGRLVDDNGRSVSEENLNRDRARLASFYKRMEARGIPAGGERALRLFV